MKGIWAWTTNKVTSITTGISERYYTVRNGISGTYYYFANGIPDTYQFITATVDSFFTIPSVKDFLYSFAIKGWEGVSRVIDPSNVTKMFHSPKTRQALRESFKANVVYYLSWAMLLEYTRAQIIYAMSLDDKESEDAWLSATTAINILFNISPGIIMLHRIYDNTMINLTLSKVVIEENPMSHHYTRCGCDDGALITAGIFSSVNLTGKLLSLWAASYLPVIKYLTPIGYVFAYGESLAEHPYSSVGMCTEHRVKKLEENNAYSLGVGGSLYLLSEAINYMVYQQTGLRGFFISSAVYNAIYPYFVTSILLREKPLPGDKQGWDFFYYQRKALQKLSGKISKQLLPRIMKCNTDSSDYDFFHMSALKDNCINKARMGGFYLSETGEYVVCDYEEKVHQGFIDAKTMDLKELKTVMQTPEFKSTILKITSEAGHTPSKMKAKLHKISEHRLVKIIMWMLSQDLYGDWHSMRGIQTSPSTILVFNEYYPLIEKQLNEITNLRETSYVGKIVPVIPEWLKRMMLSEEYNALIKVVFDKKLDNLLKEARIALKNINLIQESTQIKVIINKKWWNEMVVNEEYETNANSEKQVVIEQKPEIKRSDSHPENVKNNVTILAEPALQIKQIAVDVDVKSSETKPEEAKLEEIKNEIQIETGVEMQPQVESKASHPLSVSKELETLGLFSVQEIQKPKLVKFHKKKRELRIVDNYDPEKERENHQNQNQDDQNKDEPNSVGSSPCKSKGFGSSLNQF